MPELAGAFHTWSTPRSLIGSHWSRTRGSVSIDTTACDHGLQANQSVFFGTIEILPPEGRFDTFSHLDVIEHVADDQRDRDRRAPPCTRGRLVRLAPGHQFLFSSFDGAVGHYRRYNIKQSGSLRPTNANKEIRRNMDCVGLRTPVTNPVVLRQPVLISRQIVVWGGWMVRISHMLDYCFDYGIGKSALVVWRKMMMVGET
jgi:hypothetical protein